mmetsp:Transcript_3680/g.7159  ORF Transcript_3680/g.7159 Transcript_3680/m.7159 type:complete len:674 (+) Transcript_3680:619-2640(+)
MESGGPESPTKERRVNFHQPRTSAVAIPELGGESTNDDMARSTYLVTTPTSPSTPNTPTAGGRRNRGSSSHRQIDKESTNEYEKVMRERASKRLAKDEVNSITSASLWTNVQRVKAIAMSSKASGRRKDSDVNTLACLCEFTCQWFTTIPEDVVTKLCQHLQIETYTNNTVVYRKGEAGDKVYFVQMGSLELSDGQNSVLRKAQHVKRGEVVGEMPVLKMIPRQKTCVAKGHTELLCVTRKVYLTVFAEEFAQHNVEALKFLLHDVQLFHGLEGEAAQNFASSISVEEVPRGRVWHLETCDSLYFIQEGECKLMVPDPKDVGKPVDSYGVYGKDYKDLTNRERKELKNLKVQRMRRCHTVLHLSHNMYFGDSFNEAAILDEFNPFMGPARTGWFVQANCKCVLFEIKKADMIKLLPPFIKDRQKSEAQFRFAYYAGRYTSYFVGRERSLQNDEDREPPKKSVVAYFELPPPVLSAKVSHLIDVADTIKKQPIRHAVPAPHHAIGPSLSPAPVLIRKYYDSAASLSTRASVKMIGSLTVPLDPGFNAKTGRWAPGTRPKTPERDTMSAPHPSASLNDSFFLTGANVDLRARPGTAATNITNASVTSSHRRLHHLYPPAKLVPKWRPESPLGNVSRFTKRFDTACQGASPIHFDPNCPPMIRPYTVPHVVLEGSP